MRRGLNPAHGDGSAKFDSLIADEVFRLGDDGLLLPLGFHVRADRGFDAFHEVGLFGLFQPGFDLGGIALLLVAVLHLAEQEFPFQLFARQFLDVIDQTGLLLHEGIQFGVDLGVDFELFGQFLFFLG